MRISSHDLAVHTRQLAVLTAAGIPLLRAYETLGGPGGHPGLREICRSTVAGLLSGQRLSQCLSRFPLVFDRVYLGMIDVGERSGRLVAVLESLADWLERDNQSLRRLRGALTYPLFALVIIAGLTLLLYATVLPGFATLLRDQGTALPWPTRLIFGLADLAGSPVLWAVLGVGGTALALAAVERARTPGGREAILSFLLRLPVVGPLLTSATQARFCNSMVLMVSAGADLLSSLSLSSRASGNADLVAGCAQVCHELKAGATLSEGLAARPELFSGLVVQLALAGEQTARLPFTFARAAALLERDTEYRTEVLTALIEPILMGGMALVVGGTVVSIMLPLYASIGSLGR